jgi:hypothetical protein
MKNFIVLIVLLGNYSCSKNYGYIYDPKTKLPIQNVKVQDLKNLNNKTITDKEGKFLFSECGNLIISKIGYKTDTLEKYGCKPSGKCFDGHIFYINKQ